MQESRQTSDTSSVSQDTGYPQVSTVTSQDSISRNQVALEEPSQAQTVEPASTSTSQPGVPEQVAAAQDVVSSISPQQSLPSDMEQVLSSGTQLVLSSDTQPFLPSGTQQVPSSDAQPSLPSDVQQVLSSDVQQVLSSHVLSAGIQQSAPSAAQQATLSGLTVPQPGEDVPMLSPAQAGGMDSSESLLGKPSEVQPAASGAVVTFDVEGMELESEERGDGIEDVSEDEEDKMEEEEEEEVVARGTEGQEEAIMEVADTTQTEGRFLWGELFPPL